MGVAAAIDVTAEQQKTIQALLQRHLPGTAAWAYGSRVKWTSRPQSDLDLVVFATPRQRHQVGDLREAFDESNLPFRVDLFVWDDVPASFRTRIEAEHVPLARPTRPSCPDGWVQKRLGDVIVLKRGYDLPERDRRLGSVPVVSSSGITDHHSASKVPGPGVVTGRYGTLGQVFFVPNDFWPLNTALYVQDFKGNDPRFIGYFLRSLDFSRFSDKAAVPGLNRNHLHEETVRIPGAVAEQRAIAHILGTLDDKIELNRRLNATLEAMARALFKSWFVDFDPVRAKSTLRGQDARLTPVAAQPTSGITPPLGGSRAAKGGSPQADRWGVRWDEARRRYSPKTLERARALRGNQTDAEALLWHHLRSKQLGGFKFRRQHPVGPYIADFICLSHRLIVELDGGQHAEQKRRDSRRDAFLRGEGYRVLRFWNNEVFENCFRVLERIFAALHGDGEAHSGAGGADRGDRESAAHPPPEPPAPDGLAVPTPFQGGSDWTVEQARAYLDAMDPAVADLFPDRLVDSELGQTPEGWEPARLTELMEVNPKRSLPRGQIAPYVDMASMPTRGHVPESAVERPFGSGMRFVNGDTLVARITPCLENGKTAYVDFLRDGEVGWGVDRVHRLEAQALRFPISSPTVSPVALDSGNSQSGT